MIDPRRLHVLQAVAAHGSAPAAAGALHLSPPAVSQQLLALERETGASLIDRSGRQVALTVAGRLLAAHGERIAVPPLGGRHIAAWHQAGPPRPAPATATVLDALARTAHASRQAP